MIARPLAATPTAVPCLDCRTTGGTLDRPGGRPLRRYGYCNTCYSRLVRRGVIATKPGHKRPGRFPTGIVPAADLGWPARPAVGVADNLTRWDGPCWTTATWDFRPRDPGFAAYHDADTALAAAA